VYCNAKQVTNGQDQYAELQPKTKQKPQRKKNKAKKKTVPDASATYAVIDHRQTSSTHRSWLTHTVTGAPW